MIAKKPPIETVLPARNFTVKVEDRVRAMAAGPPAYALRKRRIEDAEDELVAKLVILLEKTGHADAAFAQASESRAIVRAIERINGWITTHNRYYPIEANLPIDPRSGALLERGLPWTPLSSLTIDALFARAGRRHAGGDDE